MVLGIDYRNANQEKLKENFGEVKYNNYCDGAQKYCAKQENKEIQKRNSVNYVAIPKRSRLPVNECVSKKSSRLPASAENLTPTQKCSNSSNDSTPFQEKNRTLHNPKCYFVLPPPKRRACTKKHIWQHGKYVKDECGSGIVPERYTFKSSREKVWCKTPLSMYQATIGEVGRKLLCGETRMTRNIIPAPPCNIDEYILPRCYGYYRKYPCDVVCEEEHLILRDGKLRSRDRIERYWDPCLTREQRMVIDVNEYAPHNAYLNKKVRRIHKDGDLEADCW